MSSGGDGGSEVVSRPSSSESPPKGHFCTGDGDGEGEGDGDS